jgi:hypothetical protein
LENGKIADRADVSGLGLSIRPARGAGAEVSRPAKMFERTGELSVKAEPGREFFAAESGL